MKPGKAIIKLAREVGATDFQITAAAILVGVHHDLGRGLDFLRGCHQKGLTAVPYQPPLFKENDHESND